MGVVYKAEELLKEVVLSSKKEKSLYDTLSVHLGFGEASSIAVAKSMGFVFASDDGAARREAKLMDVKLTGTLGILKSDLKHKRIDQIEGDFILSKMIAKGFYSADKSLEES